MSREAKRLKEISEEIREIADSMLDRPTRQQVLDAADTCESLADAIEDKEENWPGLGLD